MDLAVIPFLALAWVVNSTLTAMFAPEYVPPPPRHKVCYEVVNDGKTLVPYECIGGKGPVIDTNESGETK